MTLRFTLDPTREQHQLLLAHAGAFRMAFNHQISRVKANLDQRAAEKSYGIADADLTPSLSWSKVSLINHMNAWKDGRAPDSRVEVLEDGTTVRGLSWRSAVSADVFETASVNAAQALKNFSDSRKGARAGKAAGFPRFKSRTRRPRRSDCARRTGKAPHPRCARPVPGRCGSRSLTRSGSTSTPDSSRRCSTADASTPTPPASATSAAAGSCPSPVSPLSSTTNDAHWGSGSRGSR